MFVGRGVPDDVPEVQFTPSGGIVHLPALVAQAFGVSTSEARRSLAQGGVKVDGEPFATDLLDVPAEAVAGRVLQLGKRRFARVEIA